VVHLGHIIVDFIIAVVVHFPVRCCVHEIAACVFKLRYSELERRTRRSAVM